MDNVINNSSIKDYYIKIEKMMSNAVNILTAIHQSLSSPSPEITIDLVNTDSSVDNTTTSLRIPSYLYLESKIEQIDNIISNLFTIPKSGEAWFEKSANMYKLSLVKSNNAPAIPEISNVDNIGFNFKENTIFKDLVNPKTYVKLDLNNLPEYISQVVVNKIVINNSSDAEYLRIFNTYSDIKGALYNKQQGLDYQEYESVIDLPIKSDHFKSMFKIETVKVVENIDSTFFEYTLRLDTITYTDKDDETLQYHLQVGDLVCLPNEYAIYRIKNLTTIYNDLNDDDDNEYIVEIEEYVGHIGLQTFEENSEMYLQIYNDTYSKYHYVEVPMEENPYVILFVSTLYNNIRSPYSKAIHLNLNEIYMKDENGRYIEDNGVKVTYIDYYNKYCKNIGDIIDGLSQIIYPQVAKYDNSTLKRLINGDEIKTLVTNSLYNNDTLLLTVNRINSHLIDEKLSSDISALHNEKNEINSQLSAIQTNIDKIYNQLTTTDFSTEITVSQNTLKNQLNDYYAERISLEKQLVSVIDSINQAKSNVIGLNESKYRIRGVTDANDKYDSSVDSPIVEFLHSQFGNDCNLIGIDVEYKYRTATKDSTSIVSSNTNVFTDWNKLHTTDRERHIVFDTETNLYKIEFVNYNAFTNVIKWNQIDIPINQGEDVVIRLRYKYNIGQPFINLYTPWSNEITVQFPNEYIENTDISYIIDTNDKDYQNAQLTKTLVNYGYEEHISNKMIDNSQIFYHMPENIYSGFNTADNHLISLKDKLSELSTEILSYKSLIDNETNLKYELYLEWDSNVIKLSNSTINNIIINDTTNGNVDTFIKKTMNLIIKNIGDIPINLYSIFPGNTDIPLLECNNKYFNLQLSDYERVPILLNGSNVPSESILPQYMGQWIYFRQNNPYTNRSIYYDNYSQRVSDESYINTGNKAKFIQNSLSNYLNKDNSQLLLTYRNRKQPNIFATWGLLERIGEGANATLKYTNKNNNVDEEYNGYDNMSDYWLYENADDSQNTYILKYEHLIYEANNIENKTYLTNNVSFSEFIKPVTGVSLRNYEGAFFIPELLSTNQLLCDTKNTNQYTVLDVGKTLTIPLLFEYMLVPDDTEGKGSKSITKSLVFDIKPSLIKDPESYIIAVTAKYDYSHTITGTSSYRSLIDGLESA